MTMLAIYTRETVIAYAPRYFARIPQRRPGTQHAVVGRVCPNHPGERSYFVVKRSHREEVVAKMMAHGVMCRGHYYRVKSVDYIIASLSWHATQPDEHEAFATRQEANMALRRWALIQLPNLEPL